MLDPTKPLPDIKAEKQANNKQTRTSWKPGQSGNPNGRPRKNCTWKDLLDEAAEELVQYKTKDGKTVKQQLKKLIAMKLFQLALEGNVQAMKEIMDRMDGKPKQSVELQDQGEWNVVLHRNETA